MYRINKLKDNFCTRLCLGLSKEDTLTGEGKISVIYKHIAVAAIRKRYDLDSILSSKGKEEGKCYLFSHYVLHMCPDYYY